METYKVIALNDLQTTNNTWTKGKDYEVTETDTKFQLTSNEAQVAYVVGLKVDIMENFEVAVKEEPQSKALGEEMELEDNTPEDFFEQKVKVTETKIMQSNEGYYIGHEYFHVGFVGELLEGETPEVYGVWLPYRDSEEFYKYHKDAKKALKTGDYTLRT